MEANYVQGMRTKKVWRIIECSLSQQLLFRGSCYARPLRDDTSMEIPLFHYSGNLEFHSCAGKGDRARSGRAHVQVVCALEVGSKQQPGKPVVSCTSPCLRSVRRRLVLRLLNLLWVAQWVALRTLVSGNRTNKLQDTNMALNLIFWLRQRKHANSATIHLITEGIWFHFIFLNSLWEGMFGVA